MQLPPNPAKSRKTKVRAKAAITAASFVVLPATSAFLAGFGAAHAVGGPGAVAGSVYTDANRNGTQDSGEAGVDGITATAYTTVGGVDTQIGSPAVTAGGGLYNINLSNVSAGDAIKVVFTNLGTNTAVSLGGATQTATLATGSSGGVFTGLANLGVAPATGVTMGDRVWIDTDGNGIQNANEGAVPSQLTSISVDLLEDGLVVANTATDGNGFYLFVDSASVVSGPGIKAYAGFTAGKKYAVRVNGVANINTALSGYSNTGPNTGAADADSDGITCGTVTGTAPIGTICDPVSAEITLPAGTYSNTTIDFGFVPYDLEIAQVTNTPNVVAGGIATFVVTVTNKGPGPVQGCNIINLLPAGLTYGPTPITSLSANASEAGIDPTDTSKLRIDCNTPLAVNAQVIFTVNAVVGVSVTGPVKNFTYVTPLGTDAAAAETKPLGNPIPTNATDATGTATLNDSQASVTVSAPAGTAALGDKVWFDTNNNGIQDSGETPAPGVSVQLLDGTGAAISGRFGTTDNNGMYGFTGLNAGTYSVKFGTLPGFGYTTQNVAGSEVSDSDVNTSTGISDPVTLATGEVNPNVDAGLIAIVPAVVTTTIAAATTTTATPTTTTGVPATLPPGSVVLVTTTTSTLAPAPSSSTTSSSTTSTTTSSSPSATTKPATPVATSPGSPEVLDATCKINSVVWIDTNGNGLVDVGEQVIPGVTVRVTAGGIVKEAVTDSLGRYSFVGIQCGDVKVEIISGLPAGLPLPPAKTIRVLGETAEAPVVVPFGVQLQPGEIAFGGAESRQFFAAALTFLGMGGLLVSRKRKEANLSRR